MKQARFLVNLVCVATVGAAALVWFTRFREARRLEAELSAAQTGNSELRRALSPAAKPKSVMPGVPPASPAGANSAQEGAGGAPLDSSLATLRSWLTQHPDNSIPEIALVPEAYFRDVAATLRPGSEADLRQGARMLRTRARQLFGEVAARALGDYAADHVDALPVSMADLMPYLDPGLDTTVLSRYQILARGSYHSTGAKVPLLGEVAGVDDDFDSVLGVTRTGFTRVTSDRTITDLQRALYRYLALSGGQPPTDLTVVISYLTRPIDPDVMAKFMVNSDYLISEKK